MDSLVVLISHDQLINDQGNIAHDSTTIVYIYTLIFCTKLGCNKSDLAEP